MTVKPGEPGITITQDDAQPPEGWTAPTPPVLQALIRRIRAALNGKEAGHAG